MKAPSRTPMIAWAMVPWCAGLLGLVVLAKADGLLLLGLAGAGLAWCLLALGLALRRTWLLDLGLIPLLVTSAAVALDVRTEGTTAGFLLSLGFCAFGHALSYQVVRGFGATITALAASAAPRLATAGLLTWILVQGLDQGAGMVSGRWGDSLDRTSVPVLVVVGLLLLVVSGGTAATRVLWRRRHSTGLEHEPDLP